jgi:hypothetical protein
MACSIVFWALGISKQSDHLLLKESNYIVVGTLEGKWDLLNFHG